MGQSESASIPENLASQSGLSAVRLSTGLGLLSAQRSPRPKTPEEFRDLAKYLAYNVIGGYVEHDRGRLDKSTEAFFQVYLNLFPEVSPMLAWRAAEIYIQVLVRQDEIENHPGHTSSQIVEDPRWEEVKALLLDFSRTLGIPESYADSTMNYYRFHGVRDSRYVNYCLESDRIFNSHIIGSEYWAKILGSILLILTDCHDKHDPMGLEVGLEFARKYYEIILRAMATVPQKSMVLSQ
ncbi:MAG TPA: hypothetical protein VFV92_10360 [Candidatus Bathyarchaeia archaeon]|nr:hypothetical protein [Candidatus Bathyarchaeia archaeon]